MKTLCFVSPATPVQLKVPIADKPTKNLPVTTSTVNFRKLLLNRCQKEFEKDKVDDVVFERKQKELDSAASVRASRRYSHSAHRQQPGCFTFAFSLRQTTERDRLQEELEEAKDKARRRSIGNIKFIGELFKLKMLTEAIMHDCVVKLLKHHDEESLECLCRLLTTIGKDLDFEKAKVSQDGAAVVFGRILPPMRQKIFLCTGRFEDPVILTTERDFLAYAPQWDVDRTEELQQQQMDVGPPHRRKKYFNCTYTTPSQHLKPFRMDFDSPTDTHSHTHTIILCHT